MIIHQREIGYGENYPVFFEALVKAKQYLENKYPENSGGAHVRSGRTKRPGDDTDALCVAG